MKKEFIEQQRVRLEENKKALQRELSLFAEKDEKIKGNWKSTFPDFDSSETGGAKLEIAQDEVEEYLNRLPVEHSMEIKLQNIDLALVKVKKGTYGKCDKCGKSISLDRLGACPEAQFCVDCNGKS
jgi:DnaK suppressor protein